MKKITTEQNAVSSFYGKPRIEMNGNECLVDGLKSVVEYSDDKIIISLGNKSITFFGDDLQINSFTREGAIIQGNIISMEFSQ